MQQPTGEPILENSITAAESLSKLKAFCGIDETKLPLEFADLPLDTESKNATPSSSSSALAWLSSSLSSFSSPSSSSSASSSSSIHSVPPSPSSSSSSSLGVGRLLIAPGTVFKGSIWIPNHQQADYFVIVLEVRPEGILVMHRAHGDEQCCMLTEARSKAPPSEGEIPMQYSDRETFCAGVYNPSKGTLSGTVAQLVQAGDGFWYPADVTTHQFMLTRQEESPEIALTEWKTKDSIIRVLSAAIMGAGMRNYDTLSSVVDWGMVWNHSLRRGERVACILRQYASTLQNLTFPAAATKQSVLARIRQDIDPSKAHKLVDSIMAPLYVLFAVYETGGFINHVQGSRHFNFIHYRLDAARDTFDKALHAAESRLPEEEVKKRTSIVTKEDEGSCCICLLGFQDSDDDESESSAVLSSETSADHSVSLSSETNKYKLVLDCRHELHVACGVTWLHSHNTCPLCRAQVSVRDATQIRLA